MINDTLKGFFQNYGKAMARFGVRTGQQTHGFIERWINFFQTGAIKDGTTDLTDQFHRAAAELELKEVPEKIILDEQSRFDAAALIYSGYFLEIY